MKPVLPILLVIISAACVDRVFFDIGNDVPFTIVVEGHISDEPGPYKIEISSAYDLESKYGRTYVLAKEVALSDNQGNREVLANIDRGTYQTSPDGIRGTIGHVYTLRVELYDGRIYESIPDTLLASGKIDSVYHSFKEVKTVDGVSVYSFDVLFNATAVTKNNFHFLWKFTGTFKADTHPEFRDIMNDAAPCADAEKGYKCNFYEECSGITNVGTNVFPGPGITVPTARFVRTGPCTCCTCWYNISNDIPIVSDDQLVQDGRFTSIKIHNLPLNRWYFMYQVYATVNQLSLSRQAFRFWKAIRDQKTSVNSLFQPITGKIPSNFRQVSGPEKPIEGLFFATSISKKTIRIRRSDVPNPQIIPPVDLPWAASCLTLFPDATTQKPDFWED